MAACSPAPDIEEGTAAAPAPYPRLVNIDPLLAQAKQIGTDPTPTQDELAQRAEALRARAEALRANN
ncbi:hypothetical protein BVG79_02112 [Ketogulonicigenium robustum]|uniref:Uncharacterized protein n=1 Tax=Ketogulonicigenium robustum TaxID=92947 RepID=A0A1W6P1R1_9RHOB|nr:hypothetical protein BVG79_02112 [Ketogulonicigenium robustum]